MNPVRRRPSPETLAWVARAIAPGARVVGWRRLTGGITSSVHRVTAELRSGNRHAFVLRRLLWEPAHDPAEVVAREAATLGEVSGQGIPAPEVVAAAPTGSESGGVPSLLMTRVPGHPHLVPGDVDAWLDHVVRTLVAIHGLRVKAPAYRSWMDARKLSPPDSATHPKLWTRAAALMRETPPVSERVFLHGDYQHFNLLWRRERLTGVVDWTWSSTGPPDVDVGHCRLNLAVLFSADVAERFRRAYESEAGRSVDPWWDLHALLSYDDQWPRFIPVQVAGRAPLDLDGMTGRVEATIAGTLRRL